MILFFRKYRDKFLHPGFYVASVILGQFQEPQGTNLPSANLTDIIVNIMNWTLSIVGIVAVIGFVIAGLLYLTAAGSDERVGQAKRALLYSIVGVIVAISGLVAIRFAYNLLGANLRGY